jgi:hypothetical protein
VVDLVILEIYFEKREFVIECSSQTIFLQNDENLLQKSCVVKKAGNIYFAKKRNSKLKKIKMNYFFNASTARSNFYLFIYLFPSSIFSCCSKGDQSSATREFSQIWLQDK